MEGIAHGRLEMILSDSSAACSRAITPSVLLLFGLLFVLLPDLLYFLLQDAFESLVPSGEKQDIICLDCASTGVLREGLEVSSDSF